ncbi:MAG: Fur family transcriptional regulator, ferric uptake regulator [Frankiales bacterium]|jgi:Fur family ferric uptake transcriptional regulator|nr:Fur family transcriptional regulator, ferric uptake regulator [Frankiales bacterium]
MTTPTGDRSPHRIRITRQAVLVDEALAGSTDFRTAQDLYAQLRAAGARIGQTTVYRHLQLLADQGTVDVIRTAQGESAYRSCAGTEHHHHLICRCCSRTVELAGPEVERWLSQVTEKAGFTDISHTLEIHGTCSSCAR